MAAPLEPDPQLWLNPDRLDQLFSMVGPVASLLRQGGLLRAVLGYWVRWQVSLEAYWPDMDEEQACMNHLEQQWLSKHTLTEVGLSPDELRAKLRVTPAASIWSRHQWSHLLESLFLKRKSQLDKASCRLVRLHDKHLALELYHRIKANEASFDQVAREFGEGPERHQGGLLPLQPLESMPFGLAPLLERLQPGTISMPLSLDKGYCLVQLEEFQPSQLDPATQERLLAEQLNLWIDSVVNLLVSALGSDS